MFFKFFYYDFLIDPFFSSMLFSLLVIIFFSFLFLWLISSFMPLLSEKILETISVLLNLLRLVLCPKTWSVLENIPCALEKNVYLGFCFLFCFVFFFGCSILKIPIKLHCSVVSLRTYIALLILCIEDLSIGVSRMLESPAVNVFILISPFMSVSIGVLVY